MAKNIPVPDDSRILIYRSESGETRLEVRLQEETVWLTQRLMAELYQISVKTVNEHLVNIYSEGELSPEATIRKFRIVQTEGARQYDAFTGRRRLKAEAAAEARYMEDLRRSVKTLERQGKKPATKNRTKTK